MGIRLKGYNRDQKVKELFDMFKLPTVDYTKGYQAKPMPQPTGGSAALSGNDVGLKAVNELYKSFRRLIV